MTTAEGEGLPEQVDAEGARELIGRGEVLVVDIRDEEDFAAERMTNAVRADPDGVREAIEGHDLDRDAVLVVCSDGSRSAEVAEELRGDGVGATSIDGGFGAWTSKEFPTAPGRDEEYEGPEVKLPGAVDSSEEPDEDETEGRDEAEVGEGGREHGRPSEREDEERAERAEEV